MALNYPLTFQFKIAALSPQFSVTDNTGQQIAYIKQKLFKLKEDISVFSNEHQTNLQFKINADRWLDWSASYLFTDARNGANLGRVVRKGAKSIWRAQYELYDEWDKQDLIIKEDNPWVRFADNFLGEIPILGFFTGYLFNPKYNITRPNGTLVVQFIKKPNLLGRTFELVKIDSFEEGEEQRILLGLMMMILLERSRG